MYDITKDIKEEYLLLFAPIAILFVFLIFYLFGSRYGWLTVAAFLFFIGNRFYNADTIPKKIFGSMAMASAVGIFVGIIFCIFLGITYGYFAGIFAFVLVMVPTIFYVFTNYNIYRSEE